MVLTDRVKRRHLIGVAAGGALSATALLPEVRETIVQRASTMTNLRADASGEERLAQYRALTRDHS